MDVDGMTLARARLALREAVRAYLFDPNVGLIDFGHPEHGGQIAEDELAIRVHVRRKLSGAVLEAAVATGQTRPIPPFIAGFPTDVPEGIYRLQQQWSGWGGWGKSPAVNSARSAATRCRAASASPTKIITPLGRSVVW